MNEPLQRRIEVSAEFCDQLEGACSRGKALARFPSIRDVRAIAEPAAQGHLRALASQSAKPLAGDLGKIGDGLRHPINVPQLIVNCTPRGISSTQSVQDVVFSAWPGQRRLHILHDMRGLDAQRLSTAGAVWVLVTSTFACARKQTGDEGNGADYARTRNVENTPSPSDPATLATEQERQAPPSVSSGPLDGCRSITWTSPDEAKLEAACTQYWDETGAEPVLRYGCSCDLSACPLYGEVLDAGDPNGTPESRINDCVVDGVASGCQDSLQVACGLSTGEHGFCERPFYGLTPTRPDQVPPESAEVVCFEQEDGSHACQCPGQSELVPTEQTDCNGALLQACQAPCESIAGQCTPTEDSYDCACAAGFERSVETGLCEYALFWSCEPNCSNEAGACYLDPNGSEGIVCVCYGDREPQDMPVDPDVAGDECRTPLVATCGGSAEGHNA